MARSPEQQGKIEHFFKTKGKIEAGIGGGLLLLGAEFPWIIPLIAFGGLSYVVGKSIESRRRRKLQAGV